MFFVACILKITAIRLNTQTQFNISNVSDKNFNKVYCDYRTILLLMGKSLKFYHKSFYVLVTQLVNDKYLNLKKNIKFVK